jgi:hypothetical protein
LRSEECTIGVFAAALPFDNRFRPCKLPFESPDQPPLTRFSCHFRSDNGISHRRRALCSLQCYSAAKKSIFGRKILFLLIKYCFYSGYSIPVFSPGVEKADRLVKSSPAGWE